MGKILEGIGVWAKYWKGLALNWKLKQNGKGHLQNYATVESI